MSDGHRGLMLRRIFSLCAQTNVVRDTPDSPTRGNRAVPAAPLPGVVHDRGRRGPGHRSGRQNSPPRSAHLARERRSQEQRTGRHAPRCFRRELGVARRGGHGLGPHPRLRIPCRTRPFGKARTGTIRRNEEVSGPQLSFCDCGTHQCTRELSPAIHRSSALRNDAARRRQFEAWFCFTRGKIALKNSVRSWGKK